MPNFTILDGPIGTELNARGIETKLPLWSASAIESAPEVLSQIHRDYADAGATVHTANTFRTRRRTMGQRWREATIRAVQIAKSAVPSSHRIAGSLAPLEDCYRPDLSPDQSEVEHREMAVALAEAGCDLILCETFPHSGEALAAVSVSVQTGVETWLSLTAGPSGDLMSPREMTETAKAAVEMGVEAVLINCTPAKDTGRFVLALAEARLTVPIGAYANAGSVDDAIGWASPSEPAAEFYRSLAMQWIDSGASIVGGCCGTTPIHIAALAHI